jgi:type VI protein secretion system component VasK
MGATAMISWDRAMWEDTAAVSAALVAWGLVLVLGVAPPWGIVATGAIVGSRALRRRQTAAARRQEAAALVRCLMADPAMAPTGHPRSLARLLQAQGAPCPVSAPLYVTVDSEGSGFGTWMRRAGLTDLAVALDPRGAPHAWLARECLVLRLPTAGFAPGTVDALRRLRLQAPVQGIVVPLSAGALLRGSAEELRVQADATRRALDRLTTGLDCRPPVYVLLTQLDRVEGFEETFAQLPADIRQQVVGRTFARQGPPPDKILSQLDALIESTAAESLNLMHGAASVTARDRVYQFPQQLGRLRAPLLAWSQACFGRQHSTGPWFRGLFACAVPRGAPFFAARVWTQGILPDAWMPTARRARPPRARRVAAAAALGLVLLPEMAAWQSSAALARGQAVVGRVVVERTANDRDAMLGAVDALRDELEHWTEVDARLAAPSGHAASRRVAANLRALYLETLRDSVLQPLQSEDAQALLRLGEPTRTLSVRECERAQDRLRAQHLLSGGKVVLSPADLAWLTDFVAESWGRGIGSSEQETTRRIRRHVAAYLDALLTTPALRLSRPADLPGHWSSLDCEAVRRAAAPVAPQAGAAAVSVAAAKTSAENR